MGKKLDDAELSILKGIWLCNLHTDQPVSIDTAWHGYCSANGVPKNEESHKQITSTFYLLEDMELIEERGVDVEGDPAYWATEKGVLYMSHRRLDDALLQAVLEGDVGSIVNTLKEKGFVSGGGSIAKVIECESEAEAHQKIAQLENLLNSLSNDSNDPVPTAKPTRRFSIDDFNPSDN